MSQEEGDRPGLGWKDYLALFIAFIQTIALPLIVLILVLVGILFAVAFLR